MVAVPPAPAPVMTPVGLTLAIPGLLLLHVPPAAASLTVAVKPTHILGVPDIATGDGLTVTTADVVQAPPPIEYTIVEVPPIIPLTKPAAEMVAVAGDNELHVPPATASLREVVPPAHTVSVPNIAVGTAYTVTT